MVLSTKDGSSPGMEIKQKVKKENSLGCLGKEIEEECVRVSECIIPI